jgi:beta-phosphoglucomutase-like phosphatase (HAD superfamily)
MVIVLFDLEGTLVQSVEADPKAVLEARQLGPKLL